LEDDQPVYDREVPSGGHRVQVLAIVIRLRREVPEIEIRDYVGLLRASKIEIVSRKSVAPTSRTRVRLHKQRARLFTSLQLDEVIASSERAELRESTLGLASSAKRRLPVIINRQAMPLGSRAIERRAVLLDIVLGSTVNQIIELASIDGAELDALAAGAQIHSLHHLAIECELAIVRCGSRRNLTLSADHPASDVVAYGPHRDCARVVIGEDHTADGHTVAVVNIGRDDDKLYAREPSGVDDLSIENVLGILH